jgi:predicted transcriptional regulator
MASRKKKQSRDMYDILATFLRLCEQSTKRTHVIYRANLSHAMFQEYLQTAMRTGLVEENVDRSLTTTAKGRLFLREYLVVEKLLQGDDKKVDRNLRQDSVDELANYGV